MQAFKKAFVTPSEDASDNLSSDTDQFSNNHAQAQNSSFAKDINLSLQEEIDSIYKNLDKVKDA